MQIRDIQAALQKRGLYSGLVDGIPGTRTRNGIRAFQRQSGLSVDGIAGPETLGKLFPQERAILIPEVEGQFLTHARLKRMWPDGRPEIIAGMAASSGAVLPLHHITTKLRFCHLMAQVSHECGGGTVVEENLNYRADRILVVFKRYVTSRSEANALAMNGRALANRVYNGRMGNRTGTSDGWDYRGRGPIQITGRDGYEQVGKIAGLDLVGNPSLANEPSNLLLIACSFWTWKGINPLADRDDLLGCTKRVNGGKNGLDDRGKWLRAWKRELGI